MENFAKELSVKGFDELYSEVCSKLRKDEKFTDLGEKLRIASSDLCRIQFLVSAYPFVVQKFRNGIGESYKAKNRLKSKEFFLHALECKTSEEDGIDDLNNAIRWNPHCPPLPVSILSPTPSTPRSELELTMTESLNERNLQWFLGIPIAAEPHYEHGILVEQAGNVGAVTDENDDRELLTKIYIERSRRFHRSGEFKSCILDVFEAIKWGHEKTFEILYMVALSYKAIGPTYYSGANLLFQHYLQLLRLSRFDNEHKSVETVKVVKELKDMKSKLEKSGLEATRCPKKKTMTSPVNRLSVLKLYDGPNPDLIAASDALELKYTTELGRHAVAKKWIPAGSTLIVETPYACVLFQKMYSKFCQHCCRRIWTWSRNWVPCQRCSSMVFCNAECYEKAEHYHKFECRILKLLDSSEILGQMALLSYRTIANTPLNILETYVAHINNKISTIPGNINKALKFVQAFDNGLIVAIKKSTYSQTTI